MSKVSPINKTINNQLKDTNKNHQDTHIGHFQNAPQYMKDNIHITHGYRINFNTPRKIFNSLFMLHNQSVNIWTHLLAAIFIIGILIYFLFLIFSNTQTIQRKSTLETANITNFFDNYINCIQNISTLNQIRQKNQNNPIFQQIKTILFENYQKLVNQIITSKQNAQQKYTNLKQQVLRKIKDSFSQFQMHKKQFEQVYLPQLFTQMNNKLNSSYLFQLKNQLNILKNKIDSEISLFSLIGQPAPNLLNISQWPIIVFLLSAFVCLMCSTLFHLFYPMSKRTFLVLSRFDYAGISILIAGSGVPIFYYSMYCHFQVALIYISIAMIGGLTVFLMSLTQWFHKNEHRGFRGLTYSIYGLHYVVPVSHLLIDIVFFDKYGDPFDFKTSFPYIILLASSYLIGCRIYVQRCPERYYPGKLNVCGHSHQIWHCFCILGVIFTYIAAIESFEMRKMSLCPVKQI